MTDTREVRSSYMGVVSFRVQKQTEIQGFIDAVKFHQCSPPAGAQKGWQALQGLTLMADTVGVYNA